MDSIPQKPCCSCGAIKPLTDYHVNRTRPDGHASTCKACISARDIRDRKERGIVPRPCAMCGCPILIQRKRYCPACASIRVREYNQKYYQDNRESAQVSARKQTKRRYHESAAVRARVKQRAKEWNKRNPAKTNAQIRARRKANPDQAIAYKQNRRARVRGNGGHFTAKEWRDLKTYYDYHCLCCGKREPLIKLTPDHVIPLNHGGSSDIANIQPLCGPCNSSKGHWRITDYRAIWLK